MNLKHQHPFAGDDDGSTSTHSSFVGCYNINHKKPTVLEFLASTPLERNKTDLLLQAARLFPTPSPTNSDIPELQKERLTAHWMLCKTDKSLTSLWRTCRHINLVDAKPSVICKAVEIHSGLICPGRPASILADQAPFGTIVCFKNIQIQIQYLKLSFPASSFVGSHRNPLTCTALP